MADYGGLSRSWDFTHPNPTDEDLAFWERLECNALILAEEVGDGGLRHFQGRVTFNRKYRLSACKKLHSHVHWEVSKALADNNYFKKEGAKLLIEKGSMKRGARNDLEQVKKKLKETNSIGSIVEEVNNYNTIRMCQAILTYKETPRPVEKIRVIWYWGGTGLGKTKAVYDMHPRDEVFRPLSYKWWDGYDGHRIVLLDDFRKDFCKFHELLTLLDIYPYRVECKGGSRQIQATTFYVTSAFGPGELYESREDIEQLLRRVTEEWKFTPTGRIPINLGARAAAEGPSPVASDPPELVD